MYRHCTCYNAYPYGASSCCVVFFQVEDGIRDVAVTGVQTCALPIYLGACLALAGKRDSAVLYFRAAIERDPFTDLDPTQFTPAQLATFAEARRRTLAVAVRPVQPARVDPRTARVTFIVVATH